MDALRQACAAVAEQARHVRINRDAIPAYAASLPPAPEPDPRLHTGTIETRAAFWLTLDAINFGSGWFPTLRKRPGRSGYFTIATGLRERFDRHGPWGAAELAEIDPVTIADTLGQDPAHELMELFASSLRDLGNHVGDGAFHAVVGPSAVELAKRLGAWGCFADTSTYNGITVPFLKRAQIAASDLHRAGVGDFGDLHRLTMFADNLVPHVLRLDGILDFDEDLAERIERGRLIEHGSPEEVEIRACALHAVELIVAAGPATTAAVDIDRLLWNRGQQPRYKACARHRSRCTAY